MNCPFCQQELTVKDFHNLSLGTVCPNCQKRLVFNPSLFSLVLFMAVTYFLWLKMPVMVNFFVDFIIGFVLIFIFIIIFTRLLLVFKLGKIIESQERGKR